MNFVRVIVVVSWIWLAAAVPFFSDAGISFGLWLLFAGSGVLLAFAWLNLSIFESGLWQSSTRWWWGSVPIAIALGLFLQITDRDLDLRVSLCEGSLEKYVAGMPVGNSRDRTSRWVGLFHVEETEQFEGAVYLYTTQGFLDRHGIAFIPPGVQAVGRKRVQHLHGSWYQFTWHF